MVIRPQHRHHSVLTGGEDSLLHGEALLVVSAGDAADIALPLVADGVHVHRSADTLLVEDTHLLLIVNFK